MKMPRFMREGEFLRKLSVCPDWLLKYVGQGAARYALWRINRLICPEQVTIFITETCNLNCPHCFLGDARKRSPRRILLPEIEKLCRKNMDYLRRIVITGGEVFMLPDIKEVCFLLDKCLRLENITIATNAVYDDRVVSFVGDFLRQADTNISIQISLDGPEEFHDAFRGYAGGFRKAVKTANILQKSYRGRRNFERVFFGTVLTKKNLPFLKETINIVKKIGIETEWGYMRSPRLSVSRVPAACQNVSHPEIEELMLDFEDMQKAYEILKKEFWGVKSTVTPSDAISQVRMQRVIEYYRSFRWKVPCIAGRSDAVITADGYLALCEMTRPLASLSEYEWDITLLAREVNLQKLAREWGCSCAHECNIGNTLRTDASGISDILKAFRD